MTDKVDMNTDTNKLTGEEKQLLKREIKEAWSEFPKEMRAFIVSAKKEKLKGLYMIQDWAKKNGHETILDLITPKIGHQEDKIDRMESDLDATQK